MAEPWFEPNTFGALYGSIVGGGGGMLVGALGGVGGVLASRGKGKRFIIGAMYAFVFFGVLNFGFGAVALLQGQPYGIWFFPMVVGALIGGVVGGLIPVAKARYREAEHRHMQATDLRDQ